MSISRKWITKIEPHDEWLDFIAPFKETIICQKMNTKIHLCKMLTCEYFNRCHEGGQL